MKLYKQEIKAPIKVGGVILEKGDVIYVKAKRIAEDVDMNPGEYDMKPEFRDNVSDGFEGASFDEDEFDGEDDFADDGLADDFIDDEDEGLDDEFEDDFIDEDDLLDDEDVVYESRSKRLKKEGGGIANFGGKQAKPFKKDEAEDDEEKADDEEEEDKKDDEEKDSKKSEALRRRLASIRGRK